MKALDSARRDQIADLMAENLTSRQIAARLCMTPAAVTNQIARIRKGLGWQAR